MGLPTNSAELEAALSERFIDEVCGGKQPQEVFVHRGSVDVCALREEWNNWVDALVADGVVPIHALAIGCPDEFEE